MLYAQDRWSLLLLSQAMDAAGKGALSVPREVERPSRRGYEIGL
jgi:hypothetical protein